MSMTSNDHNQQRNLPSTIINTRLHMTSKHTRHAGLAALMIGIAFITIDVITSFGGTYGIGDHYNRAKAGANILLGHPELYTIILFVICALLSIAGPTLIHTSVFRDSSSYYTNHNHNRHDSKWMNGIPHPLIVSMWNEGWNIFDDSLTITGAILMFLSTFTGALFFLNPAPWDWVGWAGAIFFSLIFTIFTEGLAVIMPFRAAHMNEHADQEALYERYERNQYSMFAVDDTKMVDATPASSKKGLSFTRPKDALANGSSQKAQPAPPIDKKKVHVDSMTPPPAAQASLSFDDEEDAIFADAISARQATFSKKP